MAAMVGIFLLDFGGTFFYKSAQKEKEKRKGKARQGRTEARKQVSDDISA